MRPFYETPQARALTHIKTVAEVALDEKNGIDHDGALALIRGACEVQGFDLIRAAHEALSFITALRNGTPDEAADLLTNNGGEDVEAKLAKVLGVQLPY